MTLLSAAASALSGLLAAATWVGHQVRALNVAPKAWTCLDCGVPNELDRDTCWSCGAGYGEDPLYPSHIPIDRRWLCPECAVWNGIARTDCWRCGALHEVRAAAGGLSGSPGLPPGNLAPGAPGASSPRAGPRSTAGAASRRRNS